MLFRIFTLLFVVFSTLMAYGVYSRPGTVVPDLAHWMHERILEDPVFTEVFIPVDPLPVWVSWVDSVMSFPLYVTGEERASILRPGLNRVITVYNSSDGSPLPGLGVPAAISCWFKDDSLIIFTISDPYQEILGEAKVLLSSLCHSAMSGVLRDSGKGVMEGVDI